MAERSPRGPSLDAVRHDLEQIDRAIVRLLAARLDAAGTAIRCRSALDGRIANPAQEERVLARARAWGKPLGLPSGLTDAIFRAMIESGKARFAASGAPTPPVTTARGVLGRTAARETVRAGAHPT